ncbi:DUF4306 domain-containing protein [Sutcliffiella deserti]|uniref:DUF4306 domain-containing protein n=1 Tax=Sutcliffiella deserti TaxID=2875501 RepID=UPI001CBB0260|nr:DUF4306 domain-containing protein [Sutcliffiella deserti]
MTRYATLFGIGMLLLLFSIFATWYEGAEIVDRPFEWEYSTPFSGPVLEGSDISRLDYFVYAIKFKPTFPIVMAVSSIYLLAVAGHFFLKNRKRFFINYVAFMAALLLILGVLMFSSTTSGAKALSYVFLSSGALGVIISLLYYFVPFDRGVVFNKR